jgi:phosphoribosylanthranilate isomerase
MPHNSSASPYRLEAVKICGVTDRADRNLIADAGADYFGVLIDVGFSPRSISLEKAKPIFKSPPIPGIALLFNANPKMVEAVVNELNPFAVQFMGKESPEALATLKSMMNCQVWKSLYVPPKGRGDIDIEETETMIEDYEDSGADVLSVGTMDVSGGSTQFGGTGMVSDWSTIRILMRAMSVPGFLAGGLNPDNVYSAVQMVRPSGIDICTGVESELGKKDPSKLTALFKALAPLRGEG